MFQCRLTIYGPYPTTGAIAAVGGTIALLYFADVRRAPAVTIYAFEGLIVLMLALTLTRSVWAAGWLAGWSRSVLVRHFADRWLRCRARSAFVRTFVDLSDAASIANIARKPVHELCPGAE